MQCTRLCFRNNCSEPKGLSNKLRVPSHSRELIIRKQGNEGNNLLNISLNIKIVVLALERVRAY